LMLRRSPTSTLFPYTTLFRSTSGIPMELLIQERSEDFQAHFCGTHFFNPPRYLKLLEVIPSTKTKPEVVNFFLEYGSKILGKTRSEEHTSELQSRENLVCRLL